MKTINIFRACSGAGKTTKMNEMARRKKYNIISYDKMRETFFSGYTFNPRHEEMLKQIALTALERFIHLDEDIIIDNTNLNPEHVKPFIDLIKFYQSNKQIRVNWIDMTDTPLKKLLSNNQTKPVPVPEEVIKRQFNNLKKYKNFYNEIDEDNELISSSKFTECKIFDLDGTLCLKAENRGYFDEINLIDDLPNEYVLDELITAMDVGYKIVICTARTKATEEETKAWFELNKIDCSKFDFYFRDNEDRRKDHIVKEEMWRDISTKYLIHSLYDDRVQVINHARSLGLNVFAVNNKFY